MSKMTMSFEEFKALNKAQGFHWFDRDTMSFFNSRIVHWNHLGYFISSERGPMPDSPRLFTVRRADFETGNVRTVSKFQEFKTLAEAREAMGEIMLGFRDDEEES